MANGETKYKGKNIRVSEEAHKDASEHCGTLINLGAWTSEAIKEKLEREKKPKKFNPGYETKT